MDSADRPEYDLHDLAQRADVTPRTVRFYIQQGLLPSPGQVGPGVKYGSSYLARLRLIRRLQREHQPLAEIRKHLADLGDDSQVEAALQAPSSSATDYVRAILGTPGPRETPDRGRRLVEFLEGGIMRSDPATPDDSSMPRFSPSIHKTRKPTSERSQWEHIALTDDVELHVRRPLSRYANRRVERLLEQARRIFEEES